MLSPLSSASRRMLGCASSTRSSRPIPERAKRKRGGTRPQPRAVRIPGHQVVALERADQRRELDGGQLDDLGQLGEAPRRALENRGQQLRGPLGGETRLVRLGEPAISAGCAA